MLVICVLFFILGPRKLLGTEKDELGTEKYRHLSNFIDHRTCNILIINVTIFLTTVKFLL